MTDESLSEEQKEALRNAIVSKARDCLGILYYFGAEWTDYSKLPESLDCSELVEGCYRISGLKMPDGSTNQFEFTQSVPREAIKRADLAFFGKNGDPKQIYHVGLIFDEKDVIEARGHQPESSFETGKVILRPIEAWAKYKNFVGFRRHPKLA